MAFKNYKLTAEILFLFLLSLYSTDCLAARKNNCLEEFRFLSEIPIHRSLPNRPFESMFGDLHEIHLGMLDFKPAQNLKFQVVEKNPEMSFVISAKKGAGVNSATAIPKKYIDRQTPWSLNEFAPLIQKGSPRSKSGVLLKVRGNSKVVTLKLKVYDTGTELTIPIQVPASADENALREVFVPMSELRLGNKEPDLINRAKVDIDVKFAGDGEGKVELVGPILIQRDPRDTVWKDEILKIMSKGSDIGKHRKNLNIIINNLFNEKAQSHALKVLKDQNELEKFKRRTGVDIYLLKGKVDTSGKGMFFGPSSRIPWKAVPVETGAFGKEHGELSHLAQLLTITYGLNKEAEKEIVDYFSFIVKSGDESDWRVWSILFEQPGNILPTSPRYWRDKMKMSR